MGRNNKDAGQVNGLIDRGCSFEGKLMFDGTVQVNGDFRGEVLSDGTLIVGPEAKLCAQIQIDTIIVEGNVEGSIEAKGRVELRRGANLVGDITTPSLVVEDGAVFQGRSQMLGGGRATAQGAPAFEDSSAYSGEESGDSLMM
jgi:cytoskeletal protein CcmA (bactofilin family)